MSNDKLTKRQQAFEMYKEHKGKIDLVEIANSLGSPPGTVRGWKSKDKWDESLGGTFQPKKRNAPKKKPERSSKKKERSIEKPVELVIDNDDLTEAQKMFCLYYLKSFNATKAYMQAYQCGYSTANANSYRLMVNNGIKKELHRLKAELQQDVFIGVGDIVQNYAKQAVADITDYVAFGRKEVRNKHGDIKKVNYVDFRESDLVDGSVIKNVRMGKDGPVVELYDKQKAMSELMKYLAGDDSPSEIENDGFIEALELEGEALWPEDE